jgi:hypothetical protein
LFFAIASETHNFSSTKQINSEKIILLDWSLDPKYLIKDQTNMFHGGDYPAPSAFDSILWLGVQPAVKEMFIKLLKTVEHQSSELNRLDEQYKSFLSERDGSVRILMDKVSDSYSCINTKADKKNVAGLKREMLEVRRHPLLEQIEISPKLPYSISLGKMTNKLQNIWN